MGDTDRFLMSVDSRRAVQLRRLRQQDPRNIDPVEGLGDEAFVHGMGSIHVRVGRGSFAISSQWGAGISGGVRDLIRLARAALR